MKKVILRSLLPILFPLSLIFVVVIAISGVSDDSASGGSTSVVTIAGAQNISSEVTQYQSLYETYAKKWNISEYVNLAMAITMVESGGSQVGIMQSSESKGLPPNAIDNVETSIDAGMEHLAGCIALMKQYGTDIWTAVGAYNYGKAYVEYVSNHGKVYNINVAEQYSRDVVAPSLGNTTGETYTYDNPTSRKFGKLYLYRNGGNYYYVEMVKNYLVVDGSGNIASGNAGNGSFGKVLAEAEKYNGWQYSWGGKNPVMGFDCSGLVAYCYSLVGVQLTSYTVTMWEETTAVDPSQAQKGDLIFFKGTYGGDNFISHVGFYIDASTMYDSEGSGIGYHTWNSGYWLEHFAGIRRVKQ